MGTTETNSMTSLIPSLSQSFKQVPPAAIPAMLDCILASTGLSPLSLFASFLDDFPNLIKDAIKEDDKLDSDCCNYIASLVGALCHLLKKLGDNHQALQSFVWKSFLPLMKMVHVYDRETLNQIVESFFEVVIKTSTWDVLETNLVPFLLRSVGLSVGMFQSEELDVTKWGSDSFSQDSDDLLNDLDMDKDNIFSLSGSFPSSLSCHILTLTLEAALQSLQAASTTELNGCCYVEKFAANLLWDLCNMSERLLLQSLEHRSCTIGFLLPIIFKALASHCSLKVSVHGQTCILSRNYFVMKVWKCCKKLFSLGPLERRDAYSVLSIYLSFFSCAEGGENADLGDGAEEFDVRTEQEFWGEIKRGLVDEEGLVRKQSLRILKTVLSISEGSQCNSSVSEKKPHGRQSIPHGMTKRELWADKEAKSLGVGELYNSAESGLNSQQQWEAFLLLFEMLEEYGTHLVEAAWNHQVTLLLKFSFTNDNFVSAITAGSHQNQMQTFGEVFNWLSILWERGFCHSNPQVRCMIMQSFLGIEWTNYGSCAKSVPESFVLGPFMEGLNDPVHHKDFGVKGVYSSKTVQGAVQFLHQYTSSLHARKRIAFMIDFASIAKTQSYGRAGLMALAECIASSARGVGTHNGSETKWSGDAFSDRIHIDSSTVHFPRNDKTDLLDVLRFVIESSKQHFNPNYRFRVCQKILEAATLVVHACDVPLEILLHFISAFPQEFTDYNGSLRERIQEWLLACNKNCSNGSCGNEICFLKSLYDFPKGFISHHYLVETFDDEDLDAWEFESKRWARVLFLLIKEEEHVAPILRYIQNHGVNICKQNSHLDWIPVKFLILTLSVVLEIKIMQEGTAEFGIRMKNKSGTGLLETTEQQSFAGASLIYEKFADVFFSILEELVSFANLSCSIFWSGITVENATLPSSVRGKLGGPSQRRLSTSNTTAVLQAIMSMKSVASVASWCAQFKSDVQLNFALTFLWKFFWKTISSSTCDSEIVAEIRLAAYEALAPVLKALVSLFSPQALYFVRENDKSLLPGVEGKLWLDYLVFSFLENINNLLAVGVLARTRRAVFLKWKWFCLESLLSIMYNALQSELHLGHSSSFFSDAAVNCTFSDLVESLENAGEDSVLSMLRSVRLALLLFASGRLGLIASSSNGVDIQMMWRLVHSSWILHVSCNKRRVAPIAALLSSVLHSSVFNDEDMHVTDRAPGPLKWFVEKLLEEGTKSPRTIRLTALHLTGLWLSNPRTIKYYIKELKVLTLYGSVAFDEDFEAELCDNYDARTEVSLLAKSPGPELTEVFINTELYARVSVAVLFYKLANLAGMVGSEDENNECQAALESGKLFLLDLLDSVVHDKDLAKELYKKYSGIHRRKIRAWQMICVLSRFVCNDIVGQVTHSLHISLYRNNLPAVRQYLETFAINIYLRFPSLVGEQLVPILRDYDMRPQALSSYVFIAANVILHASKAVQFKHLGELLPPIIPLLTSHHHSLRGFTQLLVHQVLCKLVLPLDSRTSETIPLEKRCFEDLKAYLAKNSDCMRLRSSMEGYLDAYNPNTSVTPAGIFVNRVEEIEFECVPTSLMDQVLSFLNDVREDLRCSMAKDVVTIKNESLNIGENGNCVEMLSTSNKEKLLQQPKDVVLDFQKKIILSNHDNQDTSFSSLLGNKETYERFLELEKEDELLNQLLQSRSMEMERIRKSRQNFILVASLVDRIPNLAGLARTCEVFKASALAIADANIVLDKQFQLISVTAEKWVPIIEVPVNSVKHFLEKKKREGFSILGLEQTANSIPLDQYIFPKKTVLVLGREKEGIPVDIIHVLDACIEIPQLGVVRSLNVHVSGAIALWEYTRQQRSQ